MQHTRHTGRNILLTIIALLLIALIGGAAYAYETDQLPLIEEYAYHYLPFLSHPPYTTGAVLSGVALGLSQVQTSAWDVKAHVYTQARDPDATALVIPQDSTSTQLEAMEFLTALVPSDFDATLDVSGAAQKTATSADGEASISFDLSSEDLTASLAAQFEKVGDNYYGIVTKIPGFVGNISAIKNQWVEITPQDQKQYASMLPFDSDVPQTLNTTQAQSQKDLQTILTLEEKDNLLSSSDPVLVQEDGQALYEYDLTLNAAALPVFYNDAMQAFAGEASSTVHFDPATLAYLQSSEGEQLAKYLASNLTVTIWAETSGIPHKFESSLRLVPTDAMESLKGKQVRVTADLTLSDINQPITIDAPTSTISISDAYQDVTGQSLEEAVQESRDNTRLLDLSQIQFALQSYHGAEGGYPSTLATLEPTYLKTVPLDPLDNTSYPYTLSGAVYTLGADLESTSTPYAQFDGGKFLKTSCAGESNGRFCYQVKPLPARSNDFLFAQ